MIYLLTRAPPWLPTWPLPALTWVWTSFAPELHQAGPCSGTHTMAAGGEAHLAQGNLCDLAA